MTAIRRLFRGPARATARGPFWRALLITAMLGGFGGTALADAREALLIENKKTLYQRIITKPGAEIVPSCGAAGGSGAAVQAFSIYYVYGREDGCVEVGANSSGNTKGFIKQEQTVDWKQSAVVAFNNREDAGRQRQLLFKDHDALEKALAGSDPAADLARMREAAVQGTPPAEAGVAAIEPSASIDIEQNFYVLPILEFAQAFLPGGQSGYDLRLAAISSALPQAGPPAAPPPPRAGFVFLFDTTKSMQPYLDQATDAIHQIEQVLSADNTLGEIRFGIAGFRQSLDTNPKVEYHVKTFLPLGPASDAAAFARELPNVRASTVPTKGFDEDSFGGIRDVIENMDWQPYTSGGVVVMVTDAGSLDPQRPDLLAGGMDAEQLADLAHRKNIRLIVLHLLTPAGKTDHAQAEEQYRRLTTVDGVAAYLPVPDGRLADFHQSVDSIGRTLANFVRATATSEAVRPSDNSEAAQVMARVGRALQLDYFGTRDNVALPQFFEAWTTDRSLENSAVPALDARVMLTKNQLSSLAGALRPIVQEGEAPGSQADPAQFFQKVQELAARANNDQLKISDDTPLGAVLGEYLDDLPYRSYVLNLTKDDWVRQNRQKQREIISILKSKLAYYETIHNTPGKWTKLDEDADEGEQVTLIPLYQLP